MKSEDKISNEELYINTNLFRKYDILKNVKMNFRDKKRREMCLKLNVQKSNTKRMQLVTIDTKIHKEI